jgi:hypothetical protein
MYVILDGEVGLAKKQKTNIILDEIPTQLTSTLKWTEYG